MIKNIILDIGGVIFDDGNKNLQKVLNISAEETKKLIEKEGLDEKLNAATSLFNEDKHNMSYELFADAAEKIQLQRGKGVVSKAGAAVVGIVANDSLLGYESYVMDGLYASAYQILNL